MATATLEKPQTAADEWFDVPNIAIFDEHVNDRLADDPDPHRRRFARVDEALLAEIAARSQARIDDTGDEAPIVLGHTSKDPAVPPSPVVGFGRNFRLGRIGKTKPRAAILCDFRFPKRFRDALRSFPRRSVEVWPRDLVIDPIALLGAQTPQRDLGLMAYDRGASAAKLRYSSGPHQGEPLRYQAVPDQGRFELYDEVTTMLSDDDVQKVLNAMMQTPAMQWVQQRMQEEQAVEEQPEGPEPGMAEPGELEPGTAGVPEEMPNEEPAYAGATAGTPALNNETGRPPRNDTMPYSKEDAASFDAEKARLRRERDEADKKIAELEAKQKKQEERLRELNLSYTKQQRLGDLKRLQREGYQFDPNEVIDRVIRLSEPQFEEELQFFRKHFRRGPVDIEFNTNADGPEMLGGEWPLSGKPLTKEESQVAVAYAKETGKTYEEAMTYVMSQR